MGAVPCRAVPGAGAITLAILILLKAPASLTYKHTQPSRPRSRPVRGLENLRRTTVALYACSDRPAPPRGATRN